MVAPVAASAIASGAAAGGGLSLSSIGSFLGGLGSFGSALGGVFGGKKKGPTLQDQINGSIQLQRKSFEQSMANAKNYGIHPLMMLGAPATSGGSISVSSDPAQNTFDKLSALAQGGSDLARGIAGPSHMEQLQARLLSAQIEGQEIDNVSRASQIARMNQPANGPTMGDPRYPEQLAMGMGFGDTAPFLRAARDSRGNPIRVYNDDLGDNEALQAATAMIYSLPDWLYSAVTKPAAKVWKRGFNSIVHKK